MPDIEDLKTLAGRGGQLGQVTALQGTDALGVWRGVAGSMQLGWTTADAFIGEIPSMNLPLVRVQDIAGLIDDGQTNIASALNADMAARGEPVRYDLMSAAGAFVVNASINNQRHIIEWRSKIRMNASGQLRNIGAESATSRSLAANAPRGSVVLAMTSAIGLAPGQVIMVRDDKFASHVLGSSNNPIHIDIRRIVDISGTDVRLDQPLDHDMEMAFAARVVVLDAAVGAWQLFGPGAVIEFTATPGTFDHHTTQNLYAFRCGFRGVRILNTDAFGTRGHAFDHGRSLDCLFDDCEVRDPKFTAGGEGYGFAAYHSSRCHGYRLKLSGCRHAVVFFGAGRCVAFEPDIADVRGQGIDFHGAEEVGCGVVGGRVATAGRAATGTAGPIGARWGNPTHLQKPRDCFVNGVTFLGFGGDQTLAIDVQPCGPGNHARDVRFEDCGVGLRVTDMPGQPEMELDDFTLDGVTADSGDPVIQIRGQFHGATGSPIRRVTIRHPATTGTIRPIVASYVQELRIEGGWLRDPAAGANEYACDFRNIGSLKVIGTAIEGFERPIYLENCPGARAVIFALDIADPPAGGFNGLWLDAGGNTGSEVRNGFEAVRPTHHWIETDQNVVVPEFPGSRVYSVGLNTLTVERNFDLPVDALEGDTITVQVADQSSGGSLRVRRLFADINVTRLAPPLSWAEFTYQRSPAGGQWLHARQGSLNSLASPLLDRVETGNFGVVGIHAERRLTRCNSSSTITVTVPTHASVPLPINCRIRLARWGSGAVQIAAADGVTLHKPADKLASIRAQYSRVELWKQAANVWLLSGDLADA